MKIGLFSFLFVSVFLFSCEPEEIVEPKVVAQPEVALADAKVINSYDKQRKNLLAEGRFEPIVSNYFTKQVFTNHGLTIQGRLKRTGSNAARFDLRKADRRIRSEIVLPSETQSNRWYGMSFYLPNNFWDTDKDPDAWDIITQWHGVDDAGEPARTPPISLVVMKGQLKLVVYWATKSINTNATVSGKKVFPIGPIQKNKWVDMVYHINFSDKSDGVIEVWKSGKKVVDYRGPNCYNDKYYPYFKAGIYKRKWNKITQRVVYLDDVRSGNGNATYKDVSPSGKDLDNPDDDTVVDEYATPTVALSINNNAKTTTSAKVTLRIKTTGASEMRFYDDDDNTRWGAWMPVAATKSWTLSKGEGPKWVKVQVRNAIEELSGSKSAKILFDASGKPTVKMVINQNAGVTTSRKVTLNIRATAAKQMRFYDDANSNWTNWEAAATTKKWTLSRNNGSKWVKIQVRNAAGIMSASTFDGIILRAK